MGKSGKGSRPRWRGFRAVDSCGAAREDPSNQVIADSAVPTRPRICLLGADYANSNLGIRTLATGALTAIDAQYPNATVQMLEYGAAPQEFAFDLPSKTTRVEMLNIRFSN